MIPDLARPPMTVRHATRLPDRLRGLLGRGAIGLDEVLVIDPCASIHTFGMRFAIDVVFVGPDRRILRIDRAVAPGCVRVCWRARRVLEMAPGGADRLGLAAGDRWVDGGSR